MRYLDANIFVRYLTRDEPEMARASRALFTKIEAGDEEVRVLEAAVAEVVYVLASARLYALPGFEIRDRVGALLADRGIVMDHKARCLRALDLFAGNSSLSFGDALVAAAAEDEPERAVYSYDRGFDRVSGVVRVEP